jgi:HSP20 family molecular chaperone IbpA
MTEQKDVTNPQGKAVREQHEIEHPIRPAVDIYEDSGGITVRADMPGVAREGLEVKVDSDTLSIEGRITIPIPEGMQPLYADVRSTRYQRSFSLSRELDGDNVQASLKDGVLTLRIAKRAEHQPRKIEVRTD